MSGQARSSARLKSWAKAANIVLASSDETVSVPGSGVQPVSVVQAMTTEQSAESWTGTTYALAAFMIGRGLTDEGWRTAHGA